MDSLVLFCDVESNSMLSHSGAHNRSCTPSTVATEQDFDESVLWNERDKRFSSKICATKERKAKRQCAKARQIEFPTDATY